MSAGDVIGLVLAVAAPPTSSGRCSSRSASSAALGLAAARRARPCAARRGARARHVHRARLSATGRCPGDRVFGPVERPIYRLAASTPSASSAGRATRCRCSRSASCRSLVLYALQRFQGAPAARTRRTSPGSPPALAFNTAVSFVTNTNWQNYAGESTMSHLTQMAGLRVQNFVSAAVGLARGRRAHPRPRPRGAASTIGNFWVDLVARHRAHPAAAVASSSRSCCVEPGRRPELPRRHRRVTTVEGATQAIPGGPIASQEAIKELGTNGGGLVQRQLRPPVREPDAAHEPRSRSSLLLLIPFALTYTFGRMVGDQRQGWAIFAAMFVLWLALVGRRDRASRRTATRRVDARRGRDQAAGTWRARRCASAPPASALFAASTTGTSTGAVNCDARQLHAARRR